MVTSRRLVMCSVIVLLSTTTALRSQTGAAILRRFDKNNDGQLDEREFAEALKSFGVPVKTDAGKERAGHARQLLNAKAATIRAAIQNGTGQFDDSQPRYQRRHRQADYLLNKPFEQLTTQEHVLIERAFSDLSVAHTDSRATPEATPKAGPIISFLENNFRIRNSGDLINGELTSEDPAKVSWTHSHGQSSYYAIDGAVLYTPAYLDHNWDDIESGKVDVEKEWVFGLRVRPGFEAHVSTQAGANTNQLKYAVFFQGREKYFPGPDPALDVQKEDNIRTESLAPEQLPFLSAIYFQVAPTYETDRTARIATFGLDGKLEPSIPWLNLNHDGARRLFRLPWLEASMQGGVGLQFRQYETGKAVNGMNASYGELIGYYQGNLKLFGRLTLTAKYNAEAIAWGRGQDHNFFEGDALFTLDPTEHFTIGLSYLYGEQEPSFEKVDAVTAWVGVKF